MTFFSHFTIFFTFMFDSFYCFINYLCKNQIITESTAKTNNANRNRLHNWSLPHTLSSSFTKKKFLPYRQNTTLRLYIHFSNCIVRSTLNGGNVLEWLVTFAYAHYRINSNLFLSISLYIYKRFDRYLLMESSTTFLEKENTGGKIKWYRNLRINDQRYILSSLCCLFFVFFFRVTNRSMFFVTTYILLT